MGRGFCVFSASSAGKYRFFSVLDEYHKGWNRFFSPERQVKAVERELFPGTDGEGEKKER